MVPAGDGELIVTSLAVEREYSLICETTTAILAARTRNGPSGQRNRSSNSRHRSSVANR